MHVEPAAGPEHGRFTVRPLVPGGPSGTDMVCRIAARGGLVLTAVAVSAPVLPG